MIGSQLARSCISYEHIAELGGLRPKSHDVPENVNAYWTNESFHNYADYALSGGFALGLEKLTAVASQTPTVVMCAEALWWRCHRRIIADYVLMDGRSVIHLMGEGRFDPARMTPAAREWSGRLVYPAPPAKEL